MGPNEGRALCWICMGTLASCKMTLWYWQEHSRQVLVNASVCPSSCCDGVIVRGLLWTLLLLYIRTDWGHNNATHLLLEQIYFSALEWIGYEGTSTWGPGLLTWGQIWGQMLHMPPLQKPAKQWIKALMARYWNVVPSESYAQARHQMYPRWFESWCSVLHPWRGSWA